MAAERSRRVVIGIGNPDRGDDAAGRAVARRLQGVVRRGVAVLEQGGETTALLAALEDAVEAFLVDACASGATPGTVHRFDAAEMSLPAASFALSSHGIGLAEAVELARALGQLPPRCIVYAIEGQSFDKGAPLSPVVASAVEAVALHLGAEIAACSTAPGETGCTKPR